MTNLLDGLVPVSPKKQALALLDGLVEKPIRKKQAPRWKADALIALSRETTCSHCGSTSLEMNPLLLLREISPTGAIRETANPNACTLRIQDLPVERQTIPAGTVPFCMECIEEEGLNLHQAFLSQTARKTPKAEPNEPSVEEIVDNITDLIETGA